MDNILFIAVIFLSVCAGLYVIWMTYRLHKKYRLNYISSYLYFQIFINVFGIYGILGQAISRRILQQEGSSFRTIETIGHFFSFLGIPFLILAWYMFMRLCREIVERKLSRTFTLSYFFVLTFVFFAYGIVIVLLNLSNFKDKQYALFTSAISYLFVSLEAVALILALSQLFLQAKEVKDGKKQKATLTFAYLNLAVFCLSFLLFLLTKENSELAAIYLLVFFSRNIPPLLYWRAYLKRHFIAPVLQKTGPLTMKHFFDEFKISRREEEVIQLLSEGKSNKEISEALFVSLQTVKDHIYRIYQKTDVKNRVQLINLIQSFKSEGKK
jgi:DNA-binding CsgD family transcriptional regulator